MLNCPLCGSDLTRSGLNGNRCPFCGGLLIWEDEEQKTASGSAEDPSLPSQVPTPRPVAVEDEDEVLSIRQFVATYLFGRSPELAAPTPAVPPGQQVDAKSPPQPPTALPAAQTVSVAPHAGTTSQTIQPRDLSSADLEQVSRLWQRTVTEECTPQMTLKSDVTLTEAGGDLVIRPRSITKVRAADLQSTDYQLLDLIGEGGVGVVYAARQASVDRTVALKMLKSHLQDDVDHRTKFLMEAIVTGDLDHPNIVPIYELGSDEGGALFYSMKRVRGTPWSDVIRSKSLAENLDILMHTADAVAFAHSRGVVHRDLKPENVMLGDFGEVLVMDWGIALSTSAFVKADKISQSSSMGGTPAYMAPEMATGPIEAIGPSSDVYLLGGILFEIVTGEPPHTGADVMNCLRAAARNEIVPTKKSGELLDIAYLAMATRPEDRCASVQAFQEALRLHQTHSESIVLADSAQEKLNQANRTGNYEWYSQALFTFQEALAIWDGNARAQAGAESARLDYARCAYDKGDFDLGLSLLDPANAHHAPLHARLLAAQRERETRLQRLARVKRLAGALAMASIVILAVSLVWIRTQKKQVEDQATELRGAYELLASNQKALFAEKERALQSEREALAVKKIAEEQRAAALKSKQVAEEQRGLADTASYVAQIGLADELIANNAFLDASRLLDAHTKPAFASRRNWEWAYLHYLCHLDRQTLEMSQRVECLAALPGGKRLLVGLDDGTVRVKDVRSGDEYTRLSHGAAVHAVAVAGDGRHVATGGEGSGEIKLWQLTDDGQVVELVRSLTGHGAAISSLRFSPDGSRLLSGSHDGTARLWDWPAGNELLAFRGHFGPVSSAAFAPDGSRIVTAGEDGTVRVWTTSSGVMQARFEEHDGAVFAAEFSPDGRYVASAGQDERILVWNPEQIPTFDFTKLQQRLAAQLSKGAAAASSQPRSAESMPAPPTDAVRVLVSHTAAVHGLAFQTRLGNRSGIYLLSCGDDNTVRVWNLDAEPGASDSIRTLRGHGGWVRAAVFLADGSWIASGGFDGQVKIWDVEYYEEVRELFDATERSGLAAAALAPDGRRAITAGDNGIALLWNAEDGQPLRVLEDESTRTTLLKPTASREVADLKEGHAFLVGVAAFFPSPDPRLLTCAGDRTARLWNRETGGQLRVLERTGQTAIAALSSDGLWILTGGDNNTAQLWDGRENKPPVALEGHASEVTAVAFSHAANWNSQRIATGDASGICKLWKRDQENAPWHVYAELKAHLPGQVLTAIRFLPDDGIVLTACQDHTVMAWETDTGRRLAEQTLKHPGIVRAMDVSRDGTRVVTVCLDGDTYQLSHWDLRQATLLNSQRAEGDRTVTSIAFFNQDREAVLAAMAQDGVSSVRRWEIAQQRYGPLWTDRIRRGAVWSAVPSADGREVLTVGGNSARLWDVGSGRPLQNFRPHGALRTVAFAPSGKRAVTAGVDGDVKIWSVAESSPDFGQVIGKIAHAHGQQGVAGAVNSATFGTTPAGDDWLLTAGDDGTAKLWSLSELRIQLVRTFAGHTAPVTCAVFAPPGTPYRAATGSLDGTVLLWEGDIEKSDATTTSRVVGRGSNRAPSVSCVCFSPDGRRLAAGGLDNRIRIWNLGQDTEPLILEGHTAAITSVDFSPDGRRVVSGSRDGMAKIWDAQLGNPLLSLNRHSADVTDVCFSAAGDRVLTASGDQKAIIWLAEPLHSALATEPATAATGPGSP